MSGPDTTVELLVKLLGLLGLSDHLNLSSSNTNVSKSKFVSHDNPTVYHTFIGPGPHNYAPTTHTVSPITQLPAQPQGPIALPVQYVGLAHPYVAYQLVVPAQQPMYPTGPLQTFTTPTSGSTGQKTTLPHAFAAGTLHGLTIGAWNMNTGASSHLNNSVNSFSEIFNTCMYPSVSVGDGHSIPVTNTGHSILPTPTRSLHLNNVLITPHIVKNLISVRQFNICSSINNLIHTLLFQANLPPTFWVEALNMATQLLNILPSTAIANDICYTHLYGKDPNYTLLRIFRCLCYPHLYLSHKLEPRATPSILLGFASSYIVALTYTPTK
ncbi:hypothetical protein Tco_1232715 [Tanacetum coccineum]